jgi:hypothetical protein
MGFIVFKLRQTGARGVLRRRRQVMKTILIGAALVALALSVLAEAGERRYVPGLRHSLSPTGMATRCRPARRW